MEIEQICEEQMFCSNDEDVLSSSDENIKQDDKIKKCNNCGYFGHTVKDCKMPKNTFGILCYHKDINDDIWILMVKKKYTYEFVTFMRGVYNTPDECMRLCKYFSDFEIRFMYNICKLDFYKLWGHFWTHNMNAMRRKFYNKLKKKYETCFLPICDEVLLERFRGIDSLWEIPKGKKNYWERPIDCATREFQEETGIDKSKLIHKKNIALLKETQKGSDGTYYRFNYYVMELESKEPVFVSPLLYEQHTEIRSIRWFRLDDAIKLHNKPCCNILCTFANVVS